MLIEPANEILVAQKNYRKIIMKDYRDPVAATFANLKFA